MIRTALVLGLLMAGTAAAVTVPLPPERPGAGRPGDAANGAPVGDSWPFGASAPVAADAPLRKAPTGAGPTDAKAPTPKRPVLSDSKLAPVIARAPTRRGGPVATDVGRDVLVPITKDPITELVAPVVSGLVRTDTPEAVETPADAIAEPEMTPPKPDVAAQKAADRTTTAPEVSAPDRPDPARVTLPETKPKATDADAPPLPRKRPGDRARLDAPVVRVASATPIPTGGAKTLCGDPRLTGRTKPTVVGHVPACKIDRPIDLTSISGIVLSTPATLSCEAAQVFADWLTGAADPAARKMLGGRIKQVWVMASYTCRTRNRQRGAKMSEHSYGRAIDVGGFTLGDGRKVNVKDDWRRAKKGGYLKHVAERACGMFKTVLGPDGDRFHQDHLHLDVARRKSSYCR